MERKILILGGSSYIGRHLFARLGPRRAIATYYKTLVDNAIYFDSISMHLSEIIEDPRAISHAVILLGDTNPETCAADVKKSYILNVDSIKRIIDYLRDNHIKPIFMSSNLIFDGKKGNYVESDSPNPILTYGKQKIEVERYLQDSCNDFIIIRLAKVFGSRPGDGTIFTKWLKTIEGTHIIKCAGDQVLSPIFIDDVIESIIRLIENHCKGLFHVSTARPFARIELLKMLLGYMGRYSPRNLKIIPCSIHDFNLREKRPLNVSMIPDKLIKKADIKLSKVEDICKNIL